MEGRITERKDQIVEDGTKDGTDPLYHLQDFVCSWSSKDEIVFVDCALDGSLGVSLVFFPLLSPPSTIPMSLPCFFHSPPHP